MGRNSKIEVAQLPIIITQINIIIRAQILEATRDLGTYQIMRTMKVLKNLNSLSLILRPLSS